MLTIGVALVLFVLNSVNSQTINEIKLTASDGLPGDEFGIAVATTSDHTIIGSPGDAFRPAGVYIFSRSGQDWLQQTRLTASAGSDGDRFGQAVALDGDYAIVGANEDEIAGNFRQGSAYIFKRDGANWTVQVKLTASDGQAFAFFGFSVAINGKYAAVGAYHADDGKGAVYVFKRDNANWVEQAKLSASDGKEGDLFGVSVAIAGDRLIAGAYTDLSAGIQAGSAYIFTREGDVWIQEVKLLASDGVMNDHFGWSVAINGDRVLVGTPQTGGSGSGNGSAYVFKFDGTNWIEEGKLAPGDGVSGGEFAYSVCLAGDFALIGARSDNVMSDGSGSAYLFQRDNSVWTQVAKLTASNGGADHFFGGSVSIAGDQAVVGAFNSEDNGGGPQGSAYVYTGFSTVVAVEEQLSNNPAQFRLEQNYPNPFNPSTTIQFSLPEKSLVSLRIFNISGQEVISLVSEKLTAGQYQIDWDASGQASGVYYYQLQTEEFLQTKKLLLLK
ncbi:MAG: T9SS type A sorting domain-containing protein [bacterium]